MSYTITCPYCFKTMADDEVLFRSDRVSLGESNILPETYIDVKDFIIRYQGKDKEAILAKQEEWDFFQPQEDPVYESFWKPFGGTTEINPADAKLGVMAYRRKVIDPNNPKHQKYLQKQPDGSFFVREQGMVVAVYLNSGECCRRRVCRHCHNPLQINYGKTEVKFATVIGITGAGKTVYLSQLLKRISTYVAKAGWTVWQNAPSIRVFGENNVIKVGQPLPRSTPASSLQQPLIFSMDKMINGNNKISKTFVLYDVAGEVFTSPDLVDKFAPFIKHADGAIVLIDPNQFESINVINEKEKALDNPKAALEAIHGAVIDADDINSKCKIPFAICLAKADKPGVQQVLGDDLKELLRQDVEGSDEGGFNARQYAPIAKKLTAFVQREQRDLDLALRNSFSVYSYFAFTALGCDVKETKEGNNTISTPVGPILPKRIEEPLLWLLYRLGFIERNGPIPGEVYCPNCGSPSNEDLSGQGLVKYAGRKLFRKVYEPINRRCLDCGEEWLEPTK